MKDQKEEVKIEINDNVTDACSENDKEVMFCVAPLELAWREITRIIKLMPVTLVGLGTIKVEREMISEMIAAMGELRDANTKLGIEISRIYSSVTFPTLTYELRGEVWFRLLKRAGMLLSSAKKSLDLYGEFVDVMRVPDVAYVKCNCGEMLPIGALKLVVREALNVVRTEEQAPITSTDDNEHVSFDSIRIGELRIRLARNRLVEDIGLSESPTMDRICRDNSIVDMVHALVIDVNRYGVTGMPSTVETEDAW